MEFILTFLGIFVAVIGMAVSKAKNQSMLIGFFVGIIGYGIFFLILAQDGVGGLQPIF